MGNETFYWDGLTYITNDLWPFHEHPLKHKAISLSSPNLKSKRNAGENRKVDTLKSSLVKLRFFRALSIPTYLNVRKDLSDSGNSP